MVRDEIETVPELVLYSGKEGVGLSFEKLDEKMQSWGRRKFGDRCARDLWRDELLELKALKLGDDEMYDFAFNIHCSEVYDILSEKIVDKQMAYSTQTDSGLCLGKANAGNDRERSSTVIWKRYVPVRQHDRCRSKESTE